MDRIVVLLIIVVMSNNFFAHCKPKQYRRDEIMYTTHSMENVKMILSKEGDHVLLTGGRVKIKLKWTAMVDLDLMVFYLSKDGQTGGVFSTLYPRGNMGSLTSFPYIMLDRDAGVGASGGDNEETIIISKLDHMKEIYICVFNYTDAVHGRMSSYKIYDAVVYIIDEGSADSYAVLLNTETTGHVALVAVIDCEGRRPKLINRNAVMGLRDFIKTVPGSYLLVR
ncbi:MAG: stress response protein [Thermoproteota archaeon]